MIRYWARIRDGLKGRRWYRWLGLVLLASVGAGLLASAALIAWVWPRSGLEAPEPSAFVTDRHGRYLAQMGGPGPGDYGYWPLGQVPRRIRAAALALEDQHFHWHPGVDPLAVVRAAGQNLRAGRVVSGASTIAMQVARLQEPAPRTFGNKILEAATALVMTARHGREAVLRHYLRLVPYGNGSHGIAHAARHYLDKPAGDLSWAEVAYLAAIPHAPTRLDPLTYSGHRHAVERGRAVLDTLRARGAIDAADHALARGQIGRLRARRRAGRPPEALHAVLEIERRLRARPPDNPVVATTLDRRMQDRAVRAVDRWLGILNRLGVQQAGLIVADRETLGVRALVGSGGYERPPAGAIDYTAIPRSPGSALKPFVYALALEHRTIGPHTVLADRRAAAPGVRNADGRFIGALRPRRALANSRNVPAVDLVRRLGVSRTYRFLGRLALHDGERSAGHFGSGVAIGTLPVRLRGLIEAYGVLANDGRHRPLRWRRDSATAPGERVLATDASRLVTRFLADPMARLPSFPRLTALEYDFAVATKTGTSHAYRDSWNVAYTRDYIVGAWVGRPDAAGTKNVSGARGAANLVHDVLTGLYDLPGAPVRPRGFPRPDGYVERIVCHGARSGDADCPRRTTEWFPEGDRRPQATNATARAWARSGPAGTPVRLRITTPAQGTTVTRPPETPERLQRLPLRARTSREAKQLVWYVDGKARAVRPADEPYLWPMQPGRHTFRVGLPYRPERSPPHSLRIE